MTVLWYAIGIYMIGVAIVLYIRPRIMFHENGIWKEFGLATEADQTIFPFWMFALVWAILSYALATLVLMFFASVTMKSAESHVNASFMMPISSNPNIAPVPTMPTMSTMPTMAPVATMPTMPMSVTNTPMNSRVPGYYILDPYANPAQPRYIYYGTEPPGSA
jgi:hypothetical protein